MTEQQQEEWESIVRCARGGVRSINVGGQGRRDAILAVDAEARRLRSRLSYAAHFELPGGVEIERSTGDNHTWQVLRYPEPPGWQSLTREGAWVEGWAEGFDSADDAFAAYERAGASGGVAWTHSWAHWRSPCRRRRGSLSSASRDSSC